MFKKLKTKIQMKILDVIIAKLVDAFKAKSPKVFAVVFLAASSINVLSTQFLEHWEKMKLINPQYVDQVAGFESMIPAITQIGYYASMVVMGLSGARTTQILAQAKKEEVPK